jgi:hypothetical protein
MFQNIFHQQMHHQRSLSWQCIKLLFLDLLQNRRFIQCSYKIVISLMQAVVPAPTQTYLVSTSIIHFVNQFSNISSIKPNATKIPTFIEHKFYFLWSRLHTLSGLVSNTIQQTTARCWTIQRTGVLSHYLVAHQITWKPCQYDATQQQVQCQGCHDTYVLRCKPRVVAYRFLAAIPIVIHHFLPRGDILLCNQHQMGPVQDGHCLCDEVPASTVVHQPSQATRFCCGIHTVTRRCPNYNHHDLHPLSRAPMRKIGGNGDHSGTQDWVGIQPEPSIQACGISWQHVRNMQSCPGVLTLMQWVVYCTIWRYSLNSGDVTGLIFLLDCFPSLKHKSTFGDV